MPDEAVLREIGRLVKHENDLHQKGEESGGLTADEKQHLQDLSVSLDQCWDLLRQRRARREAGLNPDDAEVRSRRTVEGYLS